jgi:hypothetical protein
MHVGYGDCLISAARRDSCVLNAHGYLALPSEEYSCAVRLDLFHTALAYILNCREASLTEDDALRLSLDASGRTLAIQRLALLGYSGNASALGDKVLTCPAVDFLRVVIGIMAHVKEPYSFLDTAYFLLMSLLTDLVYVLWTPVPDSQLVIPYESSTMTGNRFGAPGARGKSVHVVFGSNNVTNEQGPWRHAQTGRLMTSGDTHNHFWTLDVSGVAGIHGDLL